MDEFLDSCERFSQRIDAMMNSVDNNMFAAAGLFLAAVFGITLLHGMEQGWLRNYEYGLMVPFVVAGATGLVSAAGISVWLVVKLHRD